MLPGFPAMRAVDAVPFRRPKAVSTAGNGAPGAPALNWNPPPAVFRERWR